MARLEFAGARYVRNYHLAVPHHELEIDKKKSLSKTPGLEDNLIIHGDNLKALKSLLPHFAGKVKCIYIDPPYNTGTEGWRYNDNVNSPRHKEWLNKVVDKDCQDRHDRWLSMMMPRLKLLRELLADDGLIFVSIDDNEVDKLSLLLDEIFGENNFRNTIIARRYDKNLSLQFLKDGSGLTSFAQGSEYVLVYSKTDAAELNPVYREASEERKTTGYWKGFWNAADRPTMRYTLLDVTPERGQWKWGESGAMVAVENFKLFENKFSNKMSLEEYWASTGKSKRFIRRRLDLKDGMNKGVEAWIPPSSGILRTSNWTDLLASETLDDLGLKFDNPKNRDSWSTASGLCHGGRSTRQ